MHYIRLKIRWACLHPVHIIIYLWIQIQRPTIVMATAAASRIFLKTSGCDRCMFISAAHGIPINTT